MADRRGGGQGNSRTGGPRPAGGWGPNRPRARGELWLDAFIDRVVPKRCVGCGSPAAGLCDACAAELEPPPRVAIDGYDAVHAMTAYLGLGRDLVAAVKFAGRLDAVDTLGSALAYMVDDAVDVVTWIPTAPSRRRRRGFDQGELLARAVARRLGCPAVRTLERRSAAEVHQLGRADRLGAAHLGRSRRAGEVRGRRVVVVDDVVTTGASLRLAGRLLAVDQPAALTAVVVAATP